MKRFYYFIVISLLIFGCSSNEDNDSIIPGPTSIDSSDSSDNDNQEPEQSFADIDFSNWKVTLPVDENNTGSPDEYQPADLINGGYRTNTSIQPYMYDDLNDSSIEFYTLPGVSTTNSSYSRTELRELENPSNAKDNWTLQEGGTMTGKLKIVEISEDNENANRDYHRTIIMQIHGIRSEEQMATHGFSSNNGPPLVKITWIDGYIWSYKKSLVNENITGNDLLENTSDTWSDIKVNLGYVGFDEFDFKIKASDGRLEVQLNDNEPYIYEDVSLTKWPFENYFKAGNYLGSTAENAFSKVKYYNLSVTH